MRDDNIFIVAGGSLITTTAVLTAAHNFVVMNSTELIFGAINRLIEEPNQQRRSVPSSAWIVHPDYASFNNDVAVIRFTEEPVVLNEYVQVVELASDESELFIGEEVYVSGFGIYEDLRLSEVLKFTVKNVISNQLCSVFAPGTVRDTNICAIGDSDVNNSVCTGDFGGPLTTRRAGTSLLIGVTSFGTGGCGNAGAPDGYSRVTSFYPWIAEVAELHEL